MNRFIELPFASADLDGLLARIRLGMETISSVPELTAAFPWRTYRTDGYGQNYNQEVGLKHETRGGENKYVFQYTPGAYRRTWTIGDYRSVCDTFFGALRELDRQATRISRLVATSLDLSSHRHLYDGSMTERITGGRTITRVLRYLPVANEQTDARPHVDRSLWSIHWGSTHAGLRLFKPDGAHVSIRELDPGHVAVFFGRKFAAATGSSDYSCPHGVRSCRAASEDRYAVVSFFHPVIRDDDVAWLLANDESLKERERSLAI